MSIISGEQPGKESRVGCLHDHFLDFPTKAPYPAHARQTRLGDCLWSSTRALCDGDDDPLAGLDRHRTRPNETMIDGSQTDVSRERVR